MTKPTYKDILEYFGEERFLKREIYLYKLANKIIKNHKLEDFAFVHSKLIGEVVLNYFADIKRLKNFHEIDKTDVTKIAAYTAFWFLRFKPIQIRKDFDEYDKLILNINEYGAYAIMIDIVFDSNVQLLTHDTERLVRFAEHFLYVYIYRIFTPQTIELALLGHLANPMHPVRENNPLNT